MPWLDAALISAVDVRVGCVDRATQWWNSSRPSRGRLRRSRKTEHPDRSMGGTKACPNLCAWQHPLLAESSWEGRHSPRTPHGALSARAGLEHASESWWT